MSPELFTIQCSGSIGLVLFCCPCLMFWQFLGGDNNMGTKVVRDVTRINIWHIWHMAYDSMSVWAGAGGQLKIWKREDMAYGWPGWKLVGGTKADKIYFPQLPSCSVCHFMMVWGALGHIYMIAPCASGTHKYNSFWMDACNSVGYS